MKWLAYTEHLVVLEQWAVVVDPACRPAHALYISSSWLCKARPGIALPSVPEEPSEPKVLLH
jgi:hypothetical protein